MKRYKNYTQKRIKIQQILSLQKKRNKCNFYHTQHVPNEKLNWRCVSDANCPNSKRMKMKMGSNKIKRATLAENGKNRRLQKWCRMRRAKIVQQKTKKKKKLRGYNEKECGLCAQRKYISRAYKTGGWRWKGITNGRRCWNETFCGSSYAHIRVYMYILLHACLNNRGNFANSATLHCASLNKSDMWNAGKVRLVWFQVSVSFVK